MTIRAQLLLLLSTMISLSSCRFQPNYPALPQSLLKSEKQQYFTAEEFKQDTQFLLKALDEVDLNPWQNQQRLAFISQLSKLQQQTFWLQSRLQIYRRLAPLVANFKEMHTALYYPPMFAKDDGLTLNSFPLDVQIENNKVFVSQDLSEQFMIPIGAQILTINGLKISELLTQMKQFVAKETSTGALRQIEVNFSQLLTTDIGISAPYQVGWSLGYLTTKSHLNALDQVLVNNNFSSQKTWYQKQINADTMLVAIANFETNPRHFKKFLNDWFNQIKQQGIKNLIIDLRYNAGGVGQNILQLLAHMQKKPIHWAKSINIKNSKQFRLFNKSRLKQIKKQKFKKPLRWLPIEYLNDWNWQLLFTNNGDMIEENISPQPLANPLLRFQGKIIVLTNGYCFSGCAFFVNEIKRTQRGTIIGEAPGSLTGIQYGYPILLTLPNTGLQLMLPTARIIQASTPHWVQPDIKVVTQQSDLAQRKDAFLEKALKLLKLYR